MRIRVHTVVMLGLIAFMLVDFVASVINKNKTRASLLLRTILIIGFIALAGFITAICIHASLRGEGNIVEGIKNIFEHDVLRRTNGADLNDFEEVYWPSFNASVWKPLVNISFQYRSDNGNSGKSFSVVVSYAIMYFWI